MNRKSVMANKAEMVIQNIALSNVPPLNPGASLVEIQQEINSRRATKVQIVFKGTLEARVANRKIQCVRLDGKLSLIHI